MREKIEKTISIVNTCTDDPTKLRGEGNVFGKFLTFERIDIEKACEKLRKYVKEMKCSKKLGLINFKIDEKEVLLFRNGRVIIKKAKNMDEIINTILIVRNIIFS